MMVASRFMWMGQKDTTSTHLTLEPGKLYPCSAVSDAILQAWLDKGLIMPVVMPEEGEPDPIVLEVQDGIISAEDLFGHFDKGLKEN